MNMYMFNRLKPGDKIKIFCKECGIRNSCNNIVTVIGLPELDSINVEFHPEGDVCNVMRKFITKKVR